MKPGVSTSIRRGLAPLKRSQPEFYRLLKAARRLLVRTATSPLTCLLWLQRLFLSRSPWSRRVLLVRLDAIGDYVLFRNFIESCRTSRKFRGMELDMVGNIRWKDLSEALDAKYVNRFFWIDPSSHVQRKMVQFQLNARKYSLVVQPTYSRREEHDELVRSVAGKSKVAPRGDGFNLEDGGKDLSASTYTELIDTDGSRGRFEFERNKDFFQSLLGSLIDLELPAIQAAQLGRRRTALPREYVAFHMDASEAEKCWKADNFAAVARFLTTEKKLAVVLLGGSDATSAQFPEKAGRRELIFDLQGKTSLLEAARIVAASMAFVGNDSSLLHIAAASGVKNVVGVCYGKSFGRFVPYPRRQDVNHVFVFPPRIESRRTDPGRLRELYENGAFENVDLIQPELVIKNLRSQLTPQRRRAAASRVSAR